MQSPQTTISKNILILIHGFLGSGDDWAEVINILKLKTQNKVITINLPAHFKNQNCQENKFVNFEDVEKWLQNEIIQKLIFNKVAKNVNLSLLGYSLGGRILMSALCHNYLAEFNINKVYVESAHFGLFDENEKLAREINDNNWAEQLTHQPLDTVINNWYNQNIFATINNEQKTYLKNKRIAYFAKNKISGEELAQILLTTSLAKQEYLFPQILNSKIPLHFICGNKDIKYLTLYKNAFTKKVNSKITFSIINGAGHNCHFEKVNSFCDRLLMWEDMK